MKLARLAFVLSFVAVVATGCGPAIPAVGNYASVSGHVTDAVAGAPLAGATVVVNSVLSATTDASGAYRVVTVPTGAWSYNVTGPTNYGTAAADNPAPLMPGEARTLDIRLARR